MMILLITYIHHEDHRRCCHLVLLSSFVSSSPLALQQSGKQHLPIRGST